MARIRKIPQPAIDPQSRPSEARGPWLGILLAMVGVALVLMGVYASHVVRFDGNNQAVSQRQLVREVTAKLVQRPRAGEPTTQPATQSAPANLQQDSGQADCPT